MSALETLAYDGLEANMRCLLAVRETPAEPYRLALGEVERALRSESRSARLHALRGKLLADLGRHGEGEASLRRSLELEPGQARARAWLGSALLSQGRYPEAIAELDRAVALDPALGWAFFYRAASRFGAGEAAAAERDLRLASSLRDPDAALASELFLGLLALQAGRFEESLAAVDKAVARFPDAGWPRALRAKALKGRGDKAGALAELDRAALAQPCSWIYMDRSRVLEEQGDINRALADVDSALALDGPQPELLLRHAHLQVCRRHYHLAVPDYTKVIELDPSRADAYAGRAMVHCIREDLDLALADLREAERLSGGADWARLERLRMQIYAGPGKGELAELLALERDRPESAPEARFLQGCFHLKKRAYAKAVAAFDRAGAGDPWSDHGRKAGFYRSVAASLGGKAPPAVRPLARGTARLLICGLGIRPPYTASAETLRAVHSCDFLFNNLSEPEIAGLLRLLGPRCLPTMFDVRGADARWTQTIFREIRPGRATAFVTRGHPLVCGGLACSLIEECKKVGVEYRVFGSVSSMDTLAVGALDGGAGGFPGQQVLDYSVVFSGHFRPDTGAPTVIYFNATVSELAPEEYAAFCEALEKAWSPTHPFYYYGRSFAEAPQRLELRALRPRQKEIDASFTLLIPPLGKA